MPQAGQKSGEVLHYLQERRSCSLKLMGERGPTSAEIKDMISVAARVPDHGKLNPWYFIVFDGSARRNVGELLRTAYRDEEPDASEAKLELEAERFMRAPCVILVVSRIRPAKHPVWEQILSAGAACYNLCLVANALGYGTNWLSEWYSFNDRFKSDLGLDVRDHIAGAIYIGDVSSQPDERPRPDSDALTTFWTPGADLRKGDMYDPEKPVNPPKMFYFPEEI